MYGEGMIAEGPIAEIVLPPGSPYAAVAAADPERTSVLVALIPTFQGLPVAVLNLIAKGVEPARPHVGNSILEENVLQVFAQWEQQEREKKQERRASLKGQIVLVHMG